MTITEKLIEKYGYVLIKKEVQEILKISESTLDLMRKRGEIKFTKVGGQIRFSIDDVSELLNGE